MPDKNSHAKFDPTEGNEERRREYEFHDDVIPIVETPKGIDEDIVRQISQLKGEPEWMLQLRLKGYKNFVERPQPSFGPNLDFIKFQDYRYFTRYTKGVSKSWNDVPETIKNTFKKLGIPEQEQKYLAGVNTQYESESVYSSMLKEVDDKGVIFCDTDTALKKYPELVKKYFGTVIPFNDNKYAALNTAVWSGGIFIYVPKGVHVDKPLQSYFRINNALSGQFERSLIVVDDDASLHFVEGCTAPVYSQDSLHAAVVEIVVGKRAKCRYTTIQNWSTNVVNLVTQRAVVEEDGLMEWIDGNIGSGRNMKYPCCILKGDRAKGSCISIAVGAKNQYQDNGAKMIHIGKYTSSTTISKSVVKEGGKANFRGLIKIMPQAYGARSHEECDTLILDDSSASDTIPDNICMNDSAYIEHEATVSKINETELFYLMSRGLSQSEATKTIVMGFIEPFAKELPLEYSVELSHLISLDMAKAGSVG